MDALVSFLSQMQAWHWLALALVLLVAEIATGTTYLLWPAAAAFSLAVVQSFAPLDWPMQLGLFSALTVLLTVTGRHYFKGRWLARGESEQLNERAVQLVGQRAIVSAPFSAGFGSVKVGDTVWRAAADGEFTVGQAVEIVAVDGTTLKVKAA